MGLFRNVNNVGESLVSDNIEANLIGYLQWGFLEVGAYFNIRIPTSGAYGGNAHRLRLSELQGYSTGQVWEAFRKDWIWESGIPYSTPPIKVSGIYVNGSYYPTSDTGVYAHAIDYVHGRVIFHSPIATGSVVTCEYSPRYIHVNNVDAPWFKQIQPNSLRPDGLQFTQFGSGLWSIPAEKRVQLPAIIVEVIPSVNKVGYQIGDLAAWHKQEVRFHLISETHKDLMWMHDCITNQFETDIDTFDKNVIRASGAFPLTSSGTIVSNPKSYLNLIDLFKWKSIRFAEFRSWKNEENVVRTNVEFATIRGIIELIN